MRYNKAILIRITDIQLKQINSLKATKRAKNEVFNLSSIIRQSINKYLENII
jgi:hypothetical protein